MNQVYSDALYNTLYELSEGASVPFLPTPRIKLLEQILGRKDIRVDMNDHCAFVRVKGVENAPTIVFMTHLDHPGIALKNSEKGVFFGSFGSAGTTRKEIEQMKDRIKKTPIPIKIYGPEGVYMGKGKVTKVYGGGKQKVKIETDLTVPPNSMAHWDLGEPTQDEEKIFLYSADNDVPTAAMISFLFEIFDGKKSGELSNYFNLLFVFNFHEEVNQLSSFYLAKKNILGIRNTDFIVNLECKEVIINSDEIEKGLVLQVGEVGCLYGYGFQESNNIAENLVNRAASREDLVLTTGVTKGSCDARPFSNFKITPNIVTVTVPNKNKHNVGYGSEITFEEVYKDDVNDMKRLIRGLALSKEDILDGINSFSSIAQQIKRKGDYVTSDNLMRKKIILNNRLAVAYTDWIRYKRVFPVVKKETSRDIFYKLLSYVRYLSDILTLHA